MRAARCIVKFKLNFLPFCHKIYTGLINISTGGKDDPFLIERTSHSASLWNRILHIVRTEGPRGFARRVAERGKDSIHWMYCYLLSYSLDSGAALPQAQVDFQLESLSPDDPGALRELVQIYRVPAEEQKILDRLENDELCFLAKVDGRIVGYVWIRHTGTVKEYNETLFTLAPDEVYYHDAYVLPEMRAKNIYTTMKALTGQIMAQRYGKRRAISFVRYDNHSSLGASRKLGAQRVGRIGYLKLFGKRHRYLIRHRPGPF